MNFITTQKRSGLTIIEAMVAISILTIAVIGTSAYEYGAAMNARRADLNTTAVRVALLLCEGWSGEGGDTSFDPVAEFDPDLNISVSSGPNSPSGFTKLGSYTITIEGIPYFATLSQKDTGTGLKAINVIVKWDQRGHKTCTLGDADKSYQLTTYAKKPV